jgi:hypothetical protein
LGVISLKHLHQRPLPPSRCLALLLSGLLCLDAIPVVRAQEAQPTVRLNIVIVEGEGAINNIRQRTAREPIVQVEDENHRPVAGAAVVFTLPSTGSGGVFANSSHTLTVLTDAQGRAVAAGLKPNGTAGDMQIQVDASYKGGTSHAVINQKNVLAKAARAANAGKTASIFSTKVVVIVAVAGAAAVAVGVASAAAGGGKAGTVITQGAGTVGAPH